MANPEDVQPAGAAETTPPAPETKPEVKPDEPAVPEAPKTVIVTVGGVPDGTEVSIAGAAIGVAPGPIQISRGDSPVVLTFRAEGFLPTSKSVVPDADKALDVTLKKKPRAGGTGTKPNRDDIIDVFGKKKG